MAASASPPLPGASALHAAVAPWFREHGRVLPWRGVADPYAVLVSEVMLQQTQVERVIPKYAAFMEAFPTLPALAESSPADVIRLWAGMGYNNRAVRLHRLAREVVLLHGGRLPSTVEELRRLPGVGPYTAAAVACFAFGAEVAVLDTNVYRVLSRVVYGVAAPSRSALGPVADALTPRGVDAPLPAGAWHQALMDVGATLCLPSAPRCGACPLEALCAASPHLRGGGDRRLAAQSVPYAPKQSRFAGSVRYYRGRIVDRLRETPEGALAAELAPLAEGAPVGVEELLAALERDGLLVRDGERVRLP